MNKFTKRLLVGTGVVALLGGLAACGGYQRHDDNFTENANRVVERVSEKLALNDMQKDKLTSLSTELGNIGKSMKERRDATRSEVMALLDQPTLDRDKALAMVQQRTAAINELAPTVIASIGDFYDSLDAEQQAQVREMLSQRMDKGGHHWHH